MRAERSHPDDLGGVEPRPRAGAPRGRATERAERERLARRAARESPPDPSAARLRTGATRDRRAPSRPTTPQRGVRGALGVLGVFLLALLGAGADSFVGVGLGTLTLVTLVAGTVLATLVVRRRDLGTIVVAPPLVFVGVALVNIVLAPSATFSLPTLATLLIRGFPAMAIAVAAALVLTVVRLIARR